MNPVNGFCPKIGAPFCEILISFCFCHAKAYCCRADFPIVPVGAATCRPQKTQGVFTIFFRTTSGMQSRRSRVTSFLVTIIFGSQIDLIAAVGCTSFRMEGDRREAVVEDFRHKRVEPTRPKSFIFRILRRFSPCNTKVLARRRNTRLCEN